MVTSQYKVAKSAGYEEKSSLNDSIKEMLGLEFGLMERSHIIVIKKPVQNSKIEDLEDKDKYGFGPYCCSNYMAEMMGKFGRKIKKTELPLYCSSSWLRKSSLGQGQANQLNL